MPWHGGDPESGLLEDQFPSLGWAIADALDEIFWWMPCTDEQVRKLVWHYRINPNATRRGDGWSNARVYRRSQFMGPKGVGKSPEAAKYSIAELSLDAVFDGWDANGEPVGKPWTKPTPLIQIAAVSLEQTDNTYGALLELLGEHDGIAADVLGLDAGDTRTVRRSNHRARIDKVTASAGAREGQPTVFAVLDESHLWLPENGGRKLARTIRRNVAKMSGTSLETTNAPDPGLQSVAMATDEAVVKKAPGIYQWKPEVPRLKSINNRRQVVAALEKLYVDCHWIDFDRIYDDMHDPDTTEADARRFFLNEMTEGGDHPWRRDVWDQRRHPDGLEQPPAGEQIALGFDGARFHDSTALIGVRLADHHEFVVGVWERPYDVDEDDWEVSRRDVNEAWEMAFDTWKVEKAYCDPPYWDDDVDRWEGQYGPVKKWHTHRNKPMVYAVRTFNRLLLDGSMTHDGSDELQRHTLNSVKAQTLIRDEKGQFMWRIQKPAPKSPLKIDARMAGILAHEAAGDAIADGALNTRSNDAAFA